MAEAFLVSGTHSGVGKTTISALLMTVLRERGFRIQPFKVGPDFIDSRYHLVATGQASINLDLWMMGLANLRRSFAAHAATADVAVIEGMGALFDGENGIRERGSAGFLARKLEIPVILVVDIWGMTRSTGAVLSGFLGFDPRVRIAGVIFNRAGSDKHYEMVRRSLPASLRRLTLGYVLHSESLEIPERHLGLLTVEENPLAEEEHRSRWRQGARNLDLDRLIKILGLRRNAAPGPAARAVARPEARIRLGVARDRAFCFYYRENLEALAGAGAEICPFSPTEDAALPPGLDGLYIGGGYPESFAAQLAENRSMREEIAREAARGMPIYAECGGLMYLGRSLTDFDGQRYAMTSVLPVDVAMDRAYLAIRYVAMRTLVPTPLGPAGIEARGQEFHQSRIVASEAQTGAYQVTSSTGEKYAEGIVRGNTFGSYIHVHFASNPSIPRFLVARCADYRSRRRDDSPT